MNVGAKTGYINKLHLSKMRALSLEDNAPL